MTTAFVFPGQGSQTPGMGRAFYEAWPEMRSAFDRLDDATATDLAALCFGDDADRLRRTHNTQPAVYAVSVAVASAVVERTGVDPAFVAGHSLGHYAAAAHAGLFDAVDGLRLVTARGEAMARAAETHPDGPGGMTAVLAAAPETVTAVCDSVDGAAVAAYNTDRATVLSGSVDATATVRDRVAEREPARFRELDVGAAFHSPVMDAAVDPVASALRETPTATASVPVVSDVSARPYRDAETAESELVEQVRAPVDWRGAVGTLVDAGVDRYVEMPPAGTLSGFCSRLAPDAEVVSLASPDDAAAL